MWGCISGWVLIGDCHATLHMPIPRRRTVASEELYQPGHVIRPNELDWTRLLALGGARKIIHFESAMKL